MAPTGCLVCVRAAHHTETEMKLDSKYFDRIRVKPDENRILRDKWPACQWRGCSQPAPYPAPKGRGHDGEYLHFCLDHVREYNKGYNYFSGMSDDDVATHQKRDATGHRPSWSMGANAWGRRPSCASRASMFQEGRARPRFTDPFGFFADADEAESPAEPKRKIRNVERKSLRALDLDDNASRSEIKARFKELVKRHHPDRNGGDRRKEDKLREVIQAYNYLKQAGLC